MKILVTGSAGHLGEALMRTLAHSEHEAIGMDLKPAAFTAATLHKPHVATHDRQQFVDTNISGTLSLLEQGVRAGVRAFIFTSTTRDARARFDDDNLKLNEFLYRRADIEDVVTAHLLAIEKAPAIGFDRFIISATSPFTRDDLPQLRADAAAVVKRHCPDYEHEYARRGWTMVPSIDRLYVNERARSKLGWQPRYDFHRAVQNLRESKDYRSPLAVAVGAKGYHAETFAEGPYPTEWNLNPVRPATKLHGGGMPRSARMRRM